MARQENLGASLKHPHSPQVHLQTERTMPVHAPNANPGDQVLRVKLTRDRILELGRFNGFNPDDLRFVLTLLEVGAMSREDIKGAFFQKQQGFTEKDFALPDGWEKMPLEDIRKVIKKAHPWNAAGERMYLEHVKPVDELTSIDEVRRAYGQLAYVPRAVYRVALDPSQADHEHDEVNDEFYEHGVLCADWEFDRKMIGRMLDDGKPMTCFVNDFWPYFARADKMWMLENFDIPMRSWYRVFDYGAELNLGSSWGHDIPLMSACLDGDEEMVRLLLAAGARLQIGINPDDNVDDNVIDDDDMECQDWVSIICMLVYAYRNPRRVWAPYSRIRREDVNVAEKRAMILNMMRILLDHTPGYFGDDDDDSADIGTPWCTFRGMGTGLHYFLVGYGAASDPPLRSRGLDEIVINEEVLDLLVSYGFKFDLPYGESLIDIDVKDGYPGLLRYCLHRPDCPAWRLEDGEEVHAQMVEAWKCR